MDERVEAAARVSWRLSGISIDLVRSMLAAAFPELHGDKPGWIAPWEATETMENAAWDTAPRQGDDMEPTRAYRAMRDAYLGKGDGG